MPGDRADTPERLTPTPSLREPEVEYFRLGPGAENRRLLRELLQAELFEQAMLRWRAKALGLFIATSVLVFVLLRWPALTGPSTRKLVEACWLFAVSATTIFAIFAWGAGAHRRQILDRMGEHR